MDAKGARCSLISLSVAMCEKLGFDADCQYLIRLLPRADRVGWRQKAVSYG